MKQFKRLYTKDAISAEEKTVTPTKETQNVVPTDAEFLSRVTVNPIPDEYVAVNGVVEITTNNTRVDVRNAAYADVAVPTEIDYYDGSYEVI